VSTEEKKRGEIEVAINEGGAELGIKSSDLSRGEPEKGKTGVLSKRQDAWEN